MVLQILSQTQNLVHTHKMSDGYNVYHNIKCSHDDGFDAITLKKEWQIDFWQFVR